MSFHRRRIIYSDDAVEEITDILLYTEQEWGTSQRVVYRALILETVGRLAGMPNMGRPRPEISKGLRSHPLGSHLMYYWHDDEVVTIAHILHGRQDPYAVDWSGWSDESDT